MCSCNTSRHAHSGILWSCESWTTTGYALVSRAVWYGVVWCGRYVQVCGGDHVSSSGAFTPPQRQKKDEDNSGPKFVANRRGWSSAGEHCKQERTKSVNGEADTEARV